MFRHLLRGPVHQQAKKGTSRLGWINVVFGLNKMEERKEDDMQGCIFLYLDNKWVVGNEAKGIGRIRSFTLCWKVNSLKMERIWTRKLIYHPSPSLPLPLLEPPYPSLTLLSKKTSWVLSFIVFGWRKHTIILHHAGIQHMEDLISNDLDIIKTMFTKGS